MRNKNTTNDNISALKNTDSENMTGVRKKRTKRTQTIVLDRSPLMTGVYAKIAKRTKSEHKANMFALTRINKSEHLKIKTSIKSMVFAFVFAFVRFQSEHAKPAKTLGCSFIFDSCSLCSLLAHPTH